MKTIENTKIIAIDHGYSGIKTANFITPTSVTAYDTAPVFAGNILQYGDKFYRIGEGHKPFVADKASDDDFYVLTLAAIAQELHLHGITSADIHIAAGLPLAWVKAQRESFREYLMRNKSAEFIFNNVEYKIRIVGCSIYPQGYPAIIDRLGEMSGVNMLADIGNGTINIMLIKDGKPIESRCFTEKQGVNQLVIAAGNAVSDATAVKIDDSIIETILRTGTTDIAAKYRDIIIGVARKYAAEIFETLRKYEYNPDLMKLYIVGGGGCIVRNFGEYDRDRVTIISDICATAKGYEQIALAALRKEKYGG
jgi:plasmid segregation protein ParM